MEITKIIAKPKYNITLTEEEYNVFLILVGRTSYDKLMENKYNFDCDLSVPSIKEYHNLFTQLNVNEVRFS